MLAQKRVRLIGVCFGHQVIGRSLDVKVDRSDKGWEVSVCPVTLTEKGKALFGIQDLVCHDKCTSRDRADVRRSQFTKCTVTLCTATRSLSRRSAIQIAAKCKACTQKAASSPYKATLNSMATLSANWSSGDMTKASSMMPCTMTR